MSDLELPKINQKKCIACGACVEVCPNQVLELIEGALSFVRPQDCTYCALCEGSCPQGAIRCSYEIGWA